MIKKRNCLCLNANFTAVRIPPCAFCSRPSLLRCSRSSIGVFKYSILLIKNAFVSLAKSSANNDITKPIIAGTKYTTCQRSLTFCMSVALSNGTSNVPSIATAFTIA